MPRIWDYPWAVTGSRYPRSPGRACGYERRGAFFFCGWKGGRPGFCPADVVRPKNKDDASHGNQSCLEDTTLRSQRRRGGLDHEPEPIRSRWDVVALTPW